MRVQEGQRTRTQPDHRDAPEPDAQKLTLTKGFRIISDTDLNAMKRTSYMDFFCRCCIERCCWWILAILVSLFLAALVVNKITNGQHRALIDRFFAK